MRPLPAALRPWLHLIGGLLVGFLFLGEFALNTFIVVQVLLLVLAIAGLLGAARGVRSLELWPLFVAAALVVPIMIDSRTAGLPRCDEVRSGVACFAGSRDVGRQLGLEILTLVVALVGIGALIACELRRLPRRAR